MQKVSKFATWTFGLTALALSSSANAEEVSGVKEQPNVMGQQVDPVFDVTCVRSVADKLGFAHVNLKGEVVNPAEDRVNGVDGTFRTEDGNVVRLYYGTTDEEGYLDSTVPPVGFRMIIEVDHLKDPRMTGNLLEEDAQGKHFKISAGAAVAYTEKGFAISAVHDSERDKPFREQAEKTLLNVRGQARIDCVHQ